MAVSRFMIKLGKSTADKFSMIERQIILLSHDHIKISNLLLSVLRHEDFCDRLNC